FDPEKADMVWLQTWAHMHADLVAQDGSYPLLSEMYRVVSTTGQIRMPDVAARYRLLLVRAQPNHADQWLVNRLLAHIQPFDFVARFIFDKHGSYEAYEAYPEKYREHVVNTLQTTYLKNKAAFRRKLYGIKEDCRMLDPIIQFIQRIFSAIGRGIGMLI